MKQAKSFEKGQGWWLYQRGQPTQDDGVDYGDDLNDYWEKMRASLLTEKKQQ